MITFRQLSQLALVREGIPEVLHPILADEGIYLTPDAAEDLTPMYYLKAGKWLVAPRWAGWFACNCRSARFSWPLKYVILYGERGSDWPLMRKKKSIPKVTFFDPFQKVKKTVWRDALPFESELSGGEYFGRAPSSTPKIVRVDAERRSIEWRIAGRMFSRQESASVSEICRVVCALHARHHSRVLDVRRYADWNRMHMENVDASLDEPGTTRLFSVLERIKATAPAAGQIPLTRVHNDLDPKNVLRVNSKLCFLDFDLSFEGSVWFDLIYLHLVSRSMGTEELLSQISSLNRLMGHDAEAERHELQWYMDVFLIDFARYLSILLLRGQGIHRHRREILNRLVDRAGQRAMVEVVR